MNKQWHVKAAAINILAMSVTAVSSFIGYYFSPYAGSFAQYVMLGFIKQL